MQIEWPELRFASDVRLLSQGSQQFRLRRGVWNYQEALLTFSAEQADSAAIIQTFFNKLLGGQQCDDDLKNAICQDQFALETVEKLLQENFLTMQQSAPIEQTLLGKDYQPTANRAMPQALLFCDRPQLASYLQQQGKLLELGLTAAAAECHHHLTAQDFSSSSDGIAGERNYQQAEEIINNYSHLVVVLQELNINLLRNLNQLLLRRTQKGFLLLCYLDGPFTGLTVLKPGETACFACLELRLMARMQDHQLYHRFVAEAMTQPQQLLPYSPLLHWQSGLLLGELLTLQRFNKAKLLGRMLHFYLPAYEIQYQQILRSAQCPACGYSFRSRLDELNVNSKRVLEEIRLD